MTITYRYSEFETSAEFHRFLAVCWLTGGGSNSDERIVEKLNSQDDAALTSDMSSAWSNRLDGVDAYDADEMSAAFASFRSHPPTNATLDQFRNTKGRR